MEWSIVVLASLAFILYVYLGYPVILRLLDVVLSRPVWKRPIQPQVSLLIAAHNEGRVIESKIRNSLDLDYPAERLEIVVASDGSQDDTVEIARRYQESHGVRVLAYAQNAGKISCLNKSVPQVKGDIIIFSDASSLISREALREIVVNFADPMVGAVSGVYKVLSPDKADLGRSEEVYGKYETYIKTLESSISSVLGGHGTLLAIRKELYPYPSPETINDDYVIPMRILQKGYRSVYEPKAVSWEEAREMSGFGRRIRILTGNIQQLREMGTLLWPPQWLPLFFFLSHKAGRLIVPFAMAIAFVGNLFLLHEAAYRILFVMQLAFYILALAGGTCKILPYALRLPYYFCMVNAATFWGAYRALQGDGRVPWK